MPFLIIFILWPIAELLVFVEVADEIGFLNALLLCFLTSALGFVVIKYQGFQNALNMQASIKSGKSPLNDMFSAFCFIIGGILLIIPGFLTDFIGFLLLLPPLHFILRRYLERYSKWTVVDGAASSASASGSYRNFGERGEVIEGEYEHIDEAKAQNNDQGDNKQIPDQR